MDRSFFELEAAGLPEIVGRFADKERGLIVFSGASSGAPRVADLLPVSTPLFGVSPSIVR